MVLHRRRLPLAPLAFLRLSRCLLLGGTAAPAAELFARWETKASHGAVQRATVPAGAHRRISQFAGEAFGVLGSRTQGIRAAKRGRLLLNGEMSPPEAFVRAGDLVTLLPLPAEELGGGGKHARERAIRYAQSLLNLGTLSVVYEDEAFAIVCKPAGIHTKPYGGSLALDHILPALLTPPHRADALVRPTSVRSLGTPLTPTTNPFPFALQSAARPAQGRAPAGCARRRACRVRKESPRRRGASGGVP